MNRNFAFFRTSLLVNLRKSASLKQVAQELTKHVFGSLKLSNALKQQVFELMV